jgi:hypothetical protein
MTIERRQNDAGIECWVVKAPRIRTPITHSSSFEVPLQDWRAGGVIQIGEDETITPLFTLDAMRPEFV